LGKCIFCGRRFDDDGHLFGEFCSTACIDRYFDMNPMMRQMRRDIMLQIGGICQEVFKSDEEEPVKQRHAPNFKDLTGKRYGKLTVLKYVGKDKNRHSLWLCKCDCGVEKTISSTALQAGQKSCGCEGARTTLSQRMTKHGMYKSRIYDIWHCMKDRCYREGNSKYYLYGGRGIRVCDEWKNDFVPFYEWAMSNGYKDDLTLDRIDSDGNYEPSNCRWATVTEQNRNRRCCTHSAA